MEKYSRVKAVISLDAIAHNFQAMKDNIKEGTQILAVVKADAYGHGAVQVAKLVEEYDYLWGFAAATAEEALQLKRAGIKKPILILGLVFEEHLEELAENEIRIAVSTRELARAYAQAGKRVGKPVYIHIALDTGMTRIGFADDEKSLQEICEIAGYENLHLEGMFTHFARADETDRSPAVVQLDRYMNFEKKLRAAGVTIPVCHCSNSAGIIRVSEANLHVVRAGITIYGIYPSDEVEKDIVEIEPAMELKSHITYIKTVKPDVEISYGGTYVTKKETRIATIPVGYADGYPRSLSNKGWVLIHGKKAPICGRICMDQFMVDVTDIPEAVIGDEVTLMGRDGEEFLSVDMLGDLSGRFSYEFICDLSPRVPRVYVKDNKVCGELTWFN